MRFFIVRVVWKSLESRIEGDGVGRIVDVLEILDYCFFGLLFKIVV